jgi:hypothetical protein
MVVDISVYSSRVAKSECAARYATDRILPATHHDIPAPSPLTNARESVAQKISAYRNGLMPVLFQKYARMMTLATAA